MRHVWKYVLNVCQMQFAVSALLFLCYAAGVVMVVNCWVALMTGMCQCGMSCLASVIRSTVFSLLSPKCSSIQETSLYNYWLFIRINNHLPTKCGLMGSELDSGSSGPGSRHGQGHCVVFMGKILNSHSASLHPGV